MKTFLSPKTIVIPGTSELTVNITGRMFLVTASTAAIGIAWDEQSEFGEYSAGMGYALESGDMFGQLKFKNTSGSSITITLLIGNGTVVDWRKEFSLDAATITALAAEINTGVELKVDVVLVINGAPQTFEECKSIEVIASGGNVTVTSPSGLNWVIPAGTGKDFSCEDDVNWLEDITVTCAVGATAEVSRVYI